jgi:hypothetical protein
MLALRAGHAFRKPSSVMAAGVSATSRTLKAGSTQARATSRAPLNGPIFVSKTPSTLSTVSPVMTPFSMSRDSSAFVRAALRLRDRRGI